MSKRLDIGLSALVLIGSITLPIFPYIGFSGPIGSQRVHDIINVYSLAFFDHHLKNHSKVLLDGLAKQYPEVLFETRHP